MFDQVGVMAWVFGVLVALPLVVALCSRDVERRKTAVEILRIILRRQ